MKDKNTLLVTEAIAKLAPGAEFTLSNEDYSTLKWFSPAIPIPTLQQVNQAIAAFAVSASQDSADKDQALLDVKNKLLTPVQRLEALIKVLGL